MYINSIISYDNIMARATGLWLTEVFWSIVCDGDTGCIDGLQLHPVPGLSWHAIIVCGPGLIHVELH